MKPIIEPAAFLEAYKYANPLPPKINLEIIEIPPSAGNKKTDIMFWLLIAGLCVVGGMLVINNRDKKDKTNF